MISKVLTSDSFDWDCASVRSLKVASTGLDREHAEREGDEGAQEGGVFDHEFRDLKPIKDHTILHVLAVGDEEVTGDNRNGDSFPASANESRHGLFKSQGHMFLDHKHKHPDLAVGKVLKTAYNKPMGRIELLLAADNKKCAKYLDKYEKGGDLPVSMGCTVDQETCSICKNVAPSSKQRCEHVKNDLGLVTKDGQKVFMRNPDPNYFDISAVWRPADRVGYTFRKVANDTVLEASDSLARTAGLTELHPTKLAAIRRIASIEKRLDGMARAFPSKLSAPTQKSLAAKVASAGYDAVLGALHREGLVLHPQDFFDVFIPSAEWTKVAWAIQSLEQESAMEGLLDAEASVEGLDGCRTSLALGDLPALKRACSMDAAYTQTRILTEIPVKTGAFRGSAPLEVQGMADLYRHYKVAFAAQNLDCWDRLVGVAAVPG